MAGVPAEGRAGVAKMASHAIFQYNVLVIDIDNTNTWTNMIVKMNILRLLGSSDDKEKRGVTRPEETVKKFNTPVEPMIRKRHTPV